MRKLIQLVSTHYSGTKGDGGKHLVIDYCALKKISQKLLWPMPKVEDIFSQLNGRKYFSTLNL